MRHRAVDGRERKKEKGRKEGRKDGRKEGFNPCFVCGDQHHVLVHSIWRAVRVTIGVGGK